MGEPLPHFRYHPNPIATGAIEASDTVCRCCGRSRGYIYKGPVYAIERLGDSICPWCIADGSAAARLSARFADRHYLAGAGVPDAVVDEVSLRTPAFLSWQGEAWLAHCGDACEFHGDATVTDVAHASQEARAAWLARYKQNEEGWESATRDYQPGSDSAFYKFVCRRCGMVLLGWDCS